LKGEIEKKNQFNEMTKQNQKNKDQIEKKITYHKFGFNDKIENKMKFYKVTKNKNY